MADEWEDIKPKRPERIGKILVTIGPTHINKGVRGDLFNDAPALAIKEAINADWVMVGWGYAKSGHNGITKNWTIYGKEFIAWYKRYDHDRAAVNPIDITMTLDYEKDNAPLPALKKQRRFKTFYDEERKRQLKLGV